MSWLTANWWKVGVILVAVVVGVVIVWLVKGALHKDPPPPVVPVPVDDVKAAENIVRVHEDFLRREEELRLEFESRIEEIVEEFDEKPTREELDARLDDLLDIDRGSCPLPASKPTSQPASEGDTPN